MGGRPQGAQDKRQGNTLDGNAVGQAHAAADLEGLIHLLVCPLHCGRMQVYLEEAHGIWGKLGLDSNSLA